MKMDHAPELQVVRVEVEHRERLAAIAAELEATRLQLAQIEEAPAIEPMGRRLLQWMMPVAAAALVAFVGIMTVGEDEAEAAAVARIAMELDADEVDVLDPELELQPIPEPVAVAQVEDIAEPPEPAPKPVAAPKPSRPKPPKNPKPSPLTLSNPSGDPLP